MNKAAWASGLALSVLVLAACGSQTPAAPLVSTTDDNGGSISDEPVAPANVPDGSSQQTTGNQSELWQLGWETYYSNCVAGLTTTDPSLLQVEQAACAAGATDDANKYFPP